MREILTIGKLCYEVREHHYDLVIADASASGHIVGRTRRADRHQHDLVKVGAIREPDAWMLEDSRRPGSDRGVHRHHTGGDAGQ